MGCSIGFSCSRSGINNLYLINLFNLLLIILVLFIAHQIYNWARKAQTGGFQLIPLPADPFALPYTLKSDPLRGPVFVPLNLECLLIEGKNCLFHGNILFLL